MSNLSEIEKITPALAGQILHKNAEFIRAGLRQQRLPFGTAVQGKTGRWNYLIIKSKFLKYAELEN